MIKLVARIDLMQILMLLTDVGRRSKLKPEGELVVELKKRFPFWEVWYPQHAVKCCDRPSHMREEDCWLVSGFRKGVDADVAQELEEKVVGVRLVGGHRVGGWISAGHEEERCGGRGLCTPH